jgi:hypothetical protein
MTEEKVFCNDLQPGVHIRITNKDDEVKEYVVRKMIPMQMYNNGDLTQLNDIEILLDKSKNHFFSYHMYLKGESWVKKIELLS